jgi:hypothetical protein
MYRQGMYYPTGMGAFGCCAGAMGDDAAPPATSQASAGGSGTTWVSGGILVGLAVLMFTIETKDPLKFKKTA